MNENTPIPIQMPWRMVVTDEVKALMSPECNWVYNKSNGFTMMWGRVPSEDPVMSPIPQILDIEVTTICAGPGGKPCSFCYKGNGPAGHNMSFDEFKEIIDKMPWLTQIALGADAQCESNPEIFDMMAYARDCDISPNITIADINEETAWELANLCSAVAVSRYDNKDLCYDSVFRLYEAFMEACILVNNEDPTKVKRFYSANEMIDDGWTEMEVGRYLDMIKSPEDERNEFVRKTFPINIHMMISRETITNAYELMDDVKSDPRLAWLNAVVFLSLKEKGRGSSHTRLTQEEFAALTDVAREKGVRYGFDSCTAHKYFRWLDAQEELTQAQIDDIKMRVEPCESTLLSSYINERGEFYPCSFTEGTEGWEEGINVLDVDSFEDEVWWNDRVVEFRKKLLAGCRRCPIYYI